MTTTNGNIAATGLGTVLGLAHFILVVLLLNGGAAWGDFAGWKGALLNTLLLPGGLAYLWLEPGNLVTVLLAYPANSALWGWAFAVAWRWLRRRHQGPLCDQPQK